MFPTNPSMKNNPKGTEYLLCVHETYSEQETCINKEKLIVSNSLCKSV